MNEQIKHLESIIENQKERNEKQQQRIAEVEVYVGKLIDMVNATIMKEEKDVKE
jgi:hypothetical protein